MATFFDPTLTPFMATFLFVFAVVFGLLSTAKIINDKKVNAVIALAIGAFATLYEPLVIGLQEILPLGIIFLLLLFFLIFIKKLFTGDDKKKTETLPMMLAMAVLLVALMAVGDELARFLPSGVDVNNVLWIVGILVVILIFYAAWHAKAPAQ